MTTRLEQLQAKREQIDAQIQQVKARENAQKRKDETRRKILIGGVVMKMLKSGEMPQERMDTILDKHLDNDRDRALFELPPKTKTETQGGESSEG